MKPENIILSVHERADKVLDIAVNPVSAVRDAIGIFHKHGNPTDFNFELNETGNFAIRPRYGVAIESIVGSAAEIVYVDESGAEKSLVAAL